MTKFCIIIIILGTFGAKQEKSWRKGKQEWISMQLYSKKFPALKILNFNIISNEKLIDSL